METKVKAHLVIELDLDQTDTALMIVKAGIYSDDHMNLTRNLKLVGATVFSAEGDSYDEAVKRVMDYVRAVQHIPAWKQLAEMLGRAR